MTQPKVKTRIAGFRLGPEFHSARETTVVSISIYNESLERLERMIEGGFVEGAKMQLKNLEELLKAMQAERGVAAQHPELADRCAIQESYERKRTNRKVYCGPA
jgi:hypothetical protein